MGGMAAVGDTSTNDNDDVIIPKLGPEPVLLSRKEVDVLYEILDAVRKALNKLEVDYIVTGGSLLGAIRQHSILFCDDDIDIAIIDDRPDNRTSLYESIVVPYLQETLGTDFIYQVRPWEGGDRVRAKRMNNVFLDLFVLRRFDTINDLIDIIGMKKNGQTQPESYVQGIIDKIQSSAALLDEEGATNGVPSQSQEPLFPCWHFATRKAIEMWPKEVYRENELFPLSRDLKFGPLLGIKGPRTPVRLLKRAFGDDCFMVYYQSVSHKGKSKGNAEPTTVHGRLHVENGRTTPLENGVVGELPPLVSAGGIWEGGQKVPLEEEHYLPMQPIARALRRPTLHCKDNLMEYLERQTQLEQSYLTTQASQNSSEHTTTVQRASFTTRPIRTIYMDGVFDLFHIGHLEAIKRCAELGNRVIIGVTGDTDAAGYKREPIVPQQERVAIVEALSVVDLVVCPCPLVVTETFLREHNIDLVVHGFANDADAERQYEFFEIPMRLGKFQRIPYYQGLSTTDRISKIQRLTEDDTENTILLSSEEVTNEPSKPQWFGATLAAATNNSPTIPTCPFPLALRTVIEPHLEKARIRRQEALDAIRTATGESDFDRLMTRFRKCLVHEGDFAIPGIELNRSLLSGLLESTNLPFDTDLSKLHEQPDGVDKDHLLHRLTQNPKPFQMAYDSFVREVCVPRFVAMMKDGNDKGRKGLECSEVYYQAFPCLRIVQPNEFSIGPHADVAYGHHPCSVNFYVPLTNIGGSSSIFLESRPGGEDWHSMEGAFGKTIGFRDWRICLSR